MTTVPEVREALQGLLAALVVDWNALQTTASYEIRFSPWAESRSGYRYRVTVERLPE